MRLGSFANAYMYEREEDRFFDMDALAEMVKVLEENGCDAAAFRTKVLIHQLDQCKVRARELLLVWATADRVCSMDDSTETLKAMETKMIEES